MTTSGAVAAGWSRVALGCEPLGGTDWGDVDPAQARAAVRAALDEGITVFDTADIYGLGRGERELADALGEDRHRVTIVTKGGVRWEGGEGTRARTRRDTTPEYIERALADSLRRLRLEAIPLYLVHWPDGATPLQETLECLERARADGRVLAYGVSNFAAADVRGVPARLRPSAYEAELSLLAPAASLEAFAEIAALGVPTLAYGVLAQGLLTGKYSPASTFPASDRRHRLSHFAPDAFERNELVLRAIDDVASRMDRSPAQVAIRWALDGGGASTAVVGARSPEQVRQNAAALQWRLDAAALATLGAARAAGAAAHPSP